MGGRSIEQIAIETRRSFDEYLGNGGPALEDMGAAMTIDLGNRLKKHGYRPSRVLGLYLGASEVYQPGCSQWGDLLDDPAPERTDDGFAHWWIKVEDKIVDIAADHYHPEASAAFKVVIVESGHQDYNEVDAHSLD